MKKMSMILIIVLSVTGLMIVSALIVGSILVNREGEQSVPFFTGFDKSNMLLAADKTIPIQEISKVELNLSADNCNIYASNSDSITIKHYVRNISESRYAKINSSGGVLTVSTDSAFSLEFSFFGLGSASIVEVYLPEAYKEALDVGIKSGTLRFGAPLNLSGLSVHVNSGTIRGDYAIKAPDVGVTVTSGSVKLTGGVEAESYLIKTSSGTVTVSDKLAGSGSVAVTSGSVKLSGVDITQDLSVKVSSGTVDIGIAGNPSLYFSGKRSSGTIRTYFGLYNNGNTFSATVGEKPYKNLDVEVTSGTIRITQE